MFEQKISCGVDDLGVAGRRLYDAGLEEIQLPARAREGRLDVVGEVGFDELAGEVDRLARRGDDAEDDDGFIRGAGLGERLGGRGVHQG